MRSCPWWPNVARQSSASATTKQESLTIQWSGSRSRKRSSSAESYGIPRRRIDRSAGHAGRRSSGRRQTSLRYCPHGARRTGLQHDLRRQQHLIWPAQPPNPQRHLCRGGHRRGHLLARSPTHWTTIRQAIRAADVMMGTDENCYAWIMAQRQAAAEIAGPATGEPSERV